MRIKYMSDFVGTTERKKYLDAAKGWGILMVVFGHITKLGNPIDIWFGAYKLAVFYFVSGYLLAMRQSFRKMSTGEYIKKHAKSLLIPYFGYSAFVIVYNIIVGLIKGRQTSNIIMRMLLQAYTTLSFRGISALWFLPTLFLAQVIFIFVIKSRKEIKILSAIGTVIFAWYASVCFFPMLGQMYEGRMYKIISFPLLALSKGIIGFGFVGLGYIFYFLIVHVKQKHLKGIVGIVAFIATYFLSQINGGVDLNLMGLGTSQIMFWFNSILGSVGTILMFEYLENWCKMEFLSFCGRNSLIIMATHGTLGFKGLIVNGWRVMYSLSDVAGLRYYLECTGILAELMLIECGVIAVVKNCFPWLEGKPFRKADR